MQNIIRTFALILAPLALTAVVGCDPDPGEEFISDDPEGDCNIVCTRLDQCALEGQDDFDEAACQAGCTGEGQDNFASDVFECKVCIEKEFGLGDDDTCATDFLICNSECANVVASSN